MTISLAISWCKADHDSGIKDSDKVIHHCWQLWTYNLAFETNSTDTMEKFDPLCYHLPHCKMGQRWLLGRNVNINTG